MKTNQNYQKAIENAAHVITLHELEFDSLKHKIAKAMIQYHGFYSFTDKEENLKIFVKP